MSAFTSSNIDWESSDKNTLASIDEQIKELNARKVIVEQRVVEASEPRLLVEARRIAITSAGEV